ncbi:MAG TPA: hypothetical protein DD490_05670 [Acidobacteria bacterium]|nr:hypothetical protein [Acidobacteriota bacterium]
MPEYDFLRGMSRQLRFIPGGGALVEVTCRTLQGRLLLCPSPLPAWQHLSAELYRARIAAMVREINETAAASRAESLIAPLGADGVRAQNPETRPRKLKKSPAPFCHLLRAVV